MRGRTTCLAHGGRTPRGVASPNFRTGRHSRSLPGQLLADYDRATHDPRLLSLRDEIALTGTLLADVLRQFGDAPDPAHDRDLRRQAMDLIDARRVLVEAEARHLVRAREVLTAEQAMTLVATMVEAVKRRVPDPATRQAIAEDLGGLVTGEGDPVA